MPPCSVQLHDILDFNDPEQHCYFPTKCGIKTFRLQMLISPAI